MLATVAACALVLDALEMIFVVIPVVMPALLMQVGDAAWVAVLTLLILQASFLAPPFGYAVLMVRNVLRRPPVERARSAARCFPTSAAQLAVLALTLAWPAMVWHRDSPQAAGRSPAAPSARTRNGCWSCSSTRTRRGRRARAASRARRAGPRRER